MQASLGFLISNPEKASFNFGENKESKEFFEETKMLPVGIEAPVFA